MTETYSSILPGILVLLLLDITIIPSFQMNGTVCWYRSRMEISLPTTSTGNSSCQELYNPWMGDFLDTNMRLMRNPIS
ncbi:MAG: hypothetical protein D4R64_02065 [Porphyromonadaceae bacterium]|nr:MAG: hypothetical protein D4R64_02065 [Porphyromonadaceae bacterium]